MENQIVGKSEPALPNMMLAELSEPTRRLFVQLSRLDLGLALARFLQSHTRTYLTSADIAYQLCRTPEAVESDLQKLVQMGIARVTQAADVTLYSLTLDSKQRQVMHELNSWQERWDARLDQMRQMIWGQSLHSSPPLKMLQSLTRDTSFPLLPSD